MKSQIKGTVCFDTSGVAGTVKDSYPKQSAKRHAALSKTSFPQPMEAITDLQSYSLMEERYGIREEGLF